MASFSDFVGLLFLLIFLGILAGAGLVAYSVITKASEQTQKKLNDSGVSLSDKGASIKANVSTEDYFDASRNAFVNAIKNSNLPTERRMWGLLPAKGQAKGPQPKLADTEAPEGWVHPGQAHEMTEDQKARKKLEEQYSKRGKKKDA